MSCKETAAGWQMWSKYALYHTPHKVDESLYINSNYQDEVQQQSDPLTFQDKSPKQVVWPQFTRVVGLCDFYAKWVIIESQ